MARLFNAYIDEAGDEGIRRGSRWFVLSAAIVEDSCDWEVSKVIEEICDRIGLRRGVPFHWRKHKGHANRKLYAAQQVAGQPIRVSYICVDTHKLDPKCFQARGHKVYSYFCRFLIERITWLVDDLGGRVKLVFSNRARFSYQEFQDYIRYVQTLPGNQIRPVIQSIEARPMETVRFLQIADICAGAAFDALEPDYLGLTDQRPLLEIAPLIYRRQSGSVFSYGWKLFPRPNFRELFEKYPWMQSLDKK